MIFFFYFKLFLFGNIIKNICQHIVRFHYLQKYLIHTIRMKNELKRENWEKSIINALYLH